MKNKKNNFILMILILLTLSLFNFAYAEETVILPNQNEVVEEVSPNPDPILEPIPEPIPETVLENLGETVPVSAPKVVFIVRSGDTVIFNGEVDLPEAGTTVVNDSSNISHTINSRSVLAVLKKIDEQENSFLVSNLIYYDSFGSFYLKCISQESVSELCDNWQYAIGSVTPFTSIDTTILSGNETVGIYFGSPHRIELDKSSIINGETVNAKSEKYDYKNNIWEPLVNVNIGITLPNPLDPWSPTIVALYPVNEQGIASILIDNENTYTIGIAEDYYFPSYSLVVTKKEINTASGGSVQEKIFNINDAVLYLENHQDINGSFGNNELYTDWAAIALSSFGIKNNIKNKLIEYLKTKNQISDILTDNERRAMALLSIGENPYDFYGVDYIGSILEKFNGTQFGDESLVNDDVFAIITLTKSGYTKNDNEIQKAIQFILSKQKLNGSWEDSVDMTAASLQALSLYKDVPMVTDSISIASSYLQNKQLSDGSFGNISSTAWVLQLNNILNINWVTNNKTGLNYLTTKQNMDGGVLDVTEDLQNRIWLTSYAIPAVLNKSWNDILPSVVRKIPEILNNQNANTNSFDLKTITKEEGKLKEEINNEKEKKEILNKDPSLDVPILQKSNQDNTTNILKNNYPKESIAYVDINKNNQTKDLGILKDSNTSQNLVAMAIKNKNKVPNNSLIIFLGLFIPAVFLFRFR